MSFQSYNSQALKSLMTQNTVRVLNIVFDRLYTIRNQLFHGGATCNSKANRMQLHDGCAILSELMPCVLDIMLKHHDRDWGRAFYPYVKD